tara:strand:- start:9331 stop:9813 length:483 start_codon:yes stop_codon:yes gene_type:complete
MSKSKEAGKFKIAYKGVFDLNQLLKELKNFLEKRKYDFNEKEYTEVTSSSTPRELKITWEATKDADDFYKYEINVEMVFEKLEPMKTQDDIKQYADITINIKGNLVIDKENKWDETAFKSFVFPYYLKVAGSKTATQKKALKGDAKSLQKLAKKILNLYS